MARTESCGTGARDGPERSRILRFQPFVPTVLYLALGLPALWIYRYFFNSDSALYLDMATLIGTWEFPAAFIGYWGPLLPALLALPVAMGCPPLFAGKILCFLIGLAWVLSLQVVLWPRARRVGGLVVMLTGVVPLAVLIGVPYLVLPDALLSLVLLWLYRSVRSSLRNSSRWNHLASGALLGLAYLAKPPSWALFGLPTVAFAVIGGWRGSAQAATLQSASRAAAAVAAVMAGFVLLTGLWIGGLSYRSGEFSMGATRDGALAYNYLLRGIPLPPLELRVPFQGERWLYRSPWNLKPVAPIPIDPGYILGEIRANGPTCLKFVLWCPLAGWGALSLLRRNLRKRVSIEGRLRLAFAGLPLIVMLGLTRMEMRYFLYVVPILLLEGATCLSVVIRGIRQRRGSYHRAFLVGLAVLPLVFVVRYWPVRPIGMARYAAIERASLPQDAAETLWTNRMSQAYPVALLLDRKLASDGRTADSRSMTEDADLFLWVGSTTGESTIPPQDPLAGYDLVTDWIEEDGTWMWLFRKRR